ncbi:MAG: diguanylate cyclase [bacterium]|nr:diguanylate cyclase [bacterium]
MTDKNKKPSPTSGHVLIVDDTPQNIKLLGPILQSEGYHVDVALNGVQALKMVDRVSPDLILLDIMMPEMDGYETCKRLKENPDTKDIPVIFLTAKVDTDDVVACFEAGAADYIGKPFNAAILAARVKTHVSLMKKNQELKELAQNDGLTMIANRRRFDEVLELEWRRCLRNRHPITLIMVDVDFFKAYNDYYGHLRGDEVLKEVARVLNDFSRRVGDLVARYGGEEFAAIFSNLHKEEALNLAWKMCKQIEELHIPHEESKAAPFLTASFGVATTVPDSNRSTRQLIDSADQSLYEAKHAGRNQVK